MAKAYTPGLKISKSTILKKDRILPLKGEVTVKKGDKVKAEDVVAKTDLPGNVVPLNVANKLAIPANSVEEKMLKKKGEKFEQGEIIASNKVFFGLFQSKVKAPITGTIENISTITGQVLLREPPMPIEVKAFINGVVTKIYEEEGVEIENKSAYIQGIFGIGGEVNAELKVVVEKPDEILTSELIDSSCRGKVIVGGSKVEYTALEKAKEVGAQAIIVGGIDDQDLKKFIGHDIGVAITGHEDVGLSIVVTEGFGPIKMADDTFKILNEYEGKKASVHGKTQIRAGVMRPEVIIPIPYEEEELKQAESDSHGLDIGSSIRIIRQPHFGEICEVTGLPEELHVVESETKVRILKAKTKQGEELIIPRANVEAIET